MRESRVIETNGVFIGAAVRLTRGYRFVAVNGWLAELNGSLWPTLEELRSATARRYAQASARVAIAARVSRPHPGGQVTPAAPPSP